MKNVKTYLSNGVGIFCLCGFILAANIFTTSPDDMVASTFFESLLLIPASLRMWKEFADFETVDWIGLCLAGIAITYLFFLMDCGYTNPLNMESASCMKGMKSFGFVFTLLSIAVTLISLAGAIKVWFAKHVL